MLVNIPLKAPPAAPRVVLTATSDATSPSEAVLIINVEPGLNPYLKKKMSMSLCTSIGTEKEQMKVLLNVPAKPQAKGSEELKSHRVRPE